MNSAAIKDIKLHTNSFEITVTDGVFSKTFIGVFEVPPMSTYEFARYDDEFNPRRFGRLESLNEKRAVDLRPVPEDTVPTHILNKIRWDLEEKRLASS